MIEKLYEKYLIECSNNSILEAVAFELFKEKICDKLSDMNSIAIDNGVDEQGVLYYSLWSNDGIQTCNVPVYGYYASSEKTLSKLFCKLSDTVISNGDTKFQINLYAHDYEALALFSMMQFGYIYEQGRLEITDYPYQFNDTYTIKTLEKDEIEKRWDEIWTLTDAIIKHLKQAPVFYPGHEFTEQVYKEFFMDSETNLHIALSKDDEIIGMIESNSESDVFAFHSTKSVNVGEIYVMPKYRGSSLSKDLLQFVIEHEKQKDARYLWVGHGTANPNARGFWNKYFKTDRHQVRAGLHTLRKIQRVHLRILGQYAHGLEQADQHPLKTRTPGVHRRDGRAPHGRHQGAHGAGKAHHRPDHLHRPSASGDLRRHPHRGRHQIRASAGAAQNRHGHRGFRRGLGQQAV